MVANGVPCDAEFLAEFLLVDAGMAFDFSLDGGAGAFAVAENGEEGNQAYPSTRWPRFSLAMRMASSMMSRSCGSALASVA